jgi:hypothetical protein
MDGPCRKRAQKHIAMNPPVFFANFVLFAAILNPVPGLIWFDLV